MVSGRTRWVMNGFLCHREWLAMGIHHEHMDVGVFGLVFASTARGTSCSI
jgi:hypothetical protein